MAKHRLRTFNALSPTILPRWFNARGPAQYKFITETYLENPVIALTRCANMLGYTGTYEGKRVSVMGGGMGCHP